MNAKQILKKAGLSWVGVQKTPSGDLILFNDPITETTLAIKIESFNEDAVEAKIKSSRTDFLKSTLKEDEKMFKKGDYVRRRGGQLSDLEAKVIIPVVSIKTLEDKYVSGFVGVRFQDGEAIYNYPVEALELVKED